VSPDPRTPGIAAASLAPEPLPQLLARLEGEETALLALGIPRCPACRLLPATLAALRRARPSLAVGYALLAGPEEWELRERLLWPRGIRVSRGSVPVLVALRRGRALAQRPGSAPAHVLDGWLTEALGPPEVRLEAAPTDEERAALVEMAARRAQHEAVRGR
jgi:hypothetical protein